MPAYNPRSILQLHVPPVTSTAGTAAMATQASTDANVAAQRTSAAAPTTPALATTLQMLAALPPLVPALPNTAQKATAGVLPESADALALAQLAARCIGEKRLLAIVSADALTAQRLADELPWFAPGLDVALLPDWETLPYDHFSPHQDLVSQRLATLYRVSRGECDVLVVPANTALYRLAPISYLAAFTFFLKQGTRLDVDALRAQLALAGYQHVTQVVSPGEFSVRGGLIDLFPMGSALPYRLDLFGDDIETIKTFDIDTQRTLYPVPEVRLLPAREFPLDDAGRTRFRGRYREVFEGDPSRSALYKDVSNGIAPGGIEYYLPLFFDSTATLSDYLPAGTVRGIAWRRHRRRARFWQDADVAVQAAARRQGAAAAAADRGLPAAGRVFRRDQAPPANRHSGPCSRRHRWRRRGTSHRRLCLPVRVDRRADDPIAALKRYVAAADARVLDLCRERRVAEKRCSSISPEYGLTVPPAADLPGFVAGDANPP